MVVCVLCFVFWKSAKTEGFVLGANVLIIVTGSPLYFGRRSTSTPTAICNAYLLLSNACNFHFVQSNEHSEHQGEKVRARTLLKSFVVIVGCLVVGCRWRSTIIGSTTAVTNASSSSAVASHFHQYNFGWYIHHHTCHYQQHLQRMGFATFQTTFRWRGQQEEAAVMKCSSTVVMRSLLQLHLRMICKRKKKRIKSWKKLLPLY